MEDRCPRFLGLGLFVLWALEILQQTDEIQTLKVTFVVTFEVGSKIPLSVRIAHHGIVGLDAVSRRLSNDEMLMLPYATLGNGMYTFCRADPLVGQALASEDPDELDEVVIQIARRMDGFFDEPSIVHDVGPLSD